MIDRTVDLTASVGRPVIVGIAGGVSSGKSTASASVNAELANAGITVAEIALDSFILSNAELEKAGLTDLKGYPQTYRLAEAAGALRALGNGEGCDIPRYSHVVYDVIEGAKDRIEPAQVILFEGLHVLGEPTIRGHLDVSIYMDTAETFARELYLTRFRSMVEDARTNDDSFYRWALQMPIEMAEELVMGFWTNLNEPNRLENIVTSKGHAMFVAESLPNHTVSISRG